MRRPLQKSPMFVPKRLLFTQAKLRFPKERTVKEPTVTANTSYTQTHESSTCYRSANEAVVHSQLPQTHLTDLTSYVLQCADILRVAVC